MKDYRVGFIGCGNMAQSLISGLVQKDDLPISAIVASDPDAQKRQQVSTGCHIDTVADNQDVVARSDLVIIAVKPVMMQHVLRENAEIFADKLLLSVAAGINVSSMQAWLGGDVALIRAMPNLPALVSSGMTALYASDKVSVAQRQIAADIMGAVGLVMWLDQEEQMDVVTAISGSGPAYFFYILEIIEKVAVEMGLDEKQAEVFVAQTAKGAIKVAEHSSSSKQALLEQVSSAGGTTECAINILREGQLEQLMRSAIIGAKKRAEAITEEFSG